MLCAAAGATPDRADQIQSNWYVAAGANIAIPVFNGFAYSALAKEADFRAKAGITDLSEAQLAQTQSQFGYANARYMYQTALAELRFQAGQ